MAVRRDGMSGWVMPHFEDVCGSLLAGAVRGDIVARVDAAADFFVELARRFPTSAAVGATALREAFGAERLRRCEKAVAHLSHCLGLRWDGVAEPPGRACCCAGVGGAELIAEIGVVLRCLPGRQA